MADIDKIILPNGTECNLGGGDPSNIFKNSSLFANYSASDLEKIKYIIPNNYDDTDNYEESDICNKDGVIRQANTTPTSGIFIEAEWNKVNLQQYIEFLDLVYDILLDSPSSHEYVQGDRYYNGQYTLYNGRLYRCDSETSIIGNNDYPYEDYFINVAHFTFAYNEPIKLLKCRNIGLDAFRVNKDYKENDIVSIDGTPVKFTSDYTANDPYSFEGTTVENVSDIINYLINKGINKGLPTIKVLTFTGDPNNWGPFTKIYDNKVVLSNLNNTIDSNNILSIFVTISCKFNNKNINAFISEDEYVGVKIFDEIENLFIKDTIYIDKRFGVYSGAICDGTHYEFAIRGAVCSFMNNGHIDIETILSDFSTQGTLTPVIDFIQLKIYYH